VDKPPRRLRPGAGLDGSAELVFALERRIGVRIEGEDVTADVFETLASLVVFVDSKLD
jgi:acyl carrier protein